MDENGNPVISQPEDEQENTHVEPTGKPEVPENKPNPEEEPDEEQEIAHDPINPEEEEVKEDKPVSRRESKRIEKLLDKLAQAEQGRMSPRRQQPQRRESGQIIPDGEYDTTEVNRMAQEYAQKLYNQGLSEAQAMNIANTFATRLEIDAPRVAEKYRFLDSDPDNAEFNPGPADFINRMFLNTVGYDPQTGVVQNSDLRYSEFVEGFMDVVELVASGKVAEGTRNVARRAAQTGVRPGGVAKSTYKGDDPRQMSDEQLEAMIKQGLGR